ncbi:MAG: FAD-dependent oxidoreductase, partial [Planctomycetota bacterium]
MPTTTRSVRSIKRGAPGGESRRGAVPGLPEHTDARGSSLAIHSDAGNSRSIVIGAGFAGIASALRLAAAGRRVTLIDRL